MERIRDIIKASQLGSRGVGSDPSVPLPQSLLNGSASPLQGRVRLEPFLSLLCKRAGGHAPTLQ